MGVVGSVTTWCTHWLCWCCPLPSHTHRACEARGGGGCVWCGCHHHCAPFPPTTTTVCAAPPCPLCVCVGGGTGHSGALWWHARWCGAVLGAWPPHPPPTLSTLVASLLSPVPQTHPHTHTHKWHCSLHTHGVLCVPRPIHSLTHWLPHCPHTLHTHWWVCVCSSTCSHAPSHTQRRHRRGACLAALVLWSPPPRPLCHTRTHTGTGGGRHGGGRVGTVWLPRHATHSPCLPPHTPHPPPHTPWRVVCLARLATPTTTTQPHHTHTTTATVPQWWLPLVTTPSTHTPHTPHTHQGQAQAWLWLLVWHHHHAGVGHSLSSLLPFLSTNPSFSLSCMHSLTPHPLINNTTIPSIPCVVCVCCGNGLMDGPHCG